MLFRSLWVWDSICTSTNQVANRQDNINTKELHVLHCITYTPGIRSPGPASKSIQMQSSRTKSIHRSNILCSHEQSMNHISLSKGMPRCHSKAPTHMCFAQYQMHTLALSPPILLVYAFTIIHESGRLGGKEKKTNNKQLNKCKENNNNNKTLLISCINVNAQRKSWVGPWNEALHVPTW